jgi:hypothetical protein
LAGLRRGTATSCVLKGSDDDEVEIVSTDRAVPVMEVGPPGSPCRRRSQTAAVSCRSRAGVGSDCGNGPQPAGRVCDEKTNVCEPLLTHRNNPTMASKPGLEVVPGTKARPGWRALSQAAACVLAWRCPVYRWRELVAGAGMEQENLSSRYRLGRSLGLAQPPGRREGGPQAANTARGRVPMRGTGAGRLVVAMKAL